MTRGILSQVEEWKHLMLAQRFPFKQKNVKTGEERVTAVQGALRPIQFWEYVFPEESLTDVLGGLQIRGPIERPELKTIGWALRKTLKLDKIPILDDGTKVTGYESKVKFEGKTPPVFPVHNLFMQGLAVYPIGIKKDEKKNWKFKCEDDSEVEYYQEGL